MSVYQCLMIDSFDPNMQELRQSVTVLVFLDLGVLSLTITTRAPHPCPPYTTVHALIIVHVAHHPVQLECGVLHFPRQVKK